MAKRKFDESKVSRDASGRFTKSGSTGPKLAYDIKRTNAPQNSRRLNQQNQSTTLRRNGSDHKSKHLQGRDRMRRLGSGHGKYGVR
jgi:hypothetical protein